MKCSFLPVVVIFPLIWLARGLSETQPESQCMLPSPAPKLLITRKENAGAPKMMPAIGTTERHSTSGSAGTSWNMSVLASGQGALFERQSECENPGYVPLCPGPRPCCPPSHTVCCTSQGICCLPGEMCGPSGSILCCPKGGSICGSGGCCAAGEKCCTSGLTGCCDGTCCGSECCPSGSQCCSGGNNCCDTGSTCCGNSCCPSGTTCCGGNDCCFSGETCDTTTGLCYDPALSSSLASISSLFSNPTQSGPGPSSSSPSGENPEGEEPEVEVEITIEPSDPQIQYDPSNGWSSSGGSCTNGTRSTVVIGAKITFEFEGNELSISFVPSDGNISVSVELNDVPLEDFDIPGQASPTCQLHNSWNKTFSSSNSQQSVSFIYNGSSSSSLGKRANPVFELGEIRYKKLSPSSSHAIMQTIAPGFVFTLGTVALILLMTIPM